MADRSRPPYVFGHVDRQRFGNRYLDAGVVARRPTNRTTRKAATMPKAVLTPDLSAGRLSVDWLMNQPTMLVQKLSEVIASEQLMPLFYSPYPGQLQAGSLAYVQLGEEHLYVIGGTDAIEQRLPGAEYGVVGGDFPEPKIAKVEDYGAKVQILDEERKRNSLLAFNTKIGQLANTIRAKIDQRAYALINASPAPTIPATTAWDNLVLVGPDATITPGPSRPSALFAQAQGLVDADGQGVVLDILLCNPDQAVDLRTAYMDNLPALLGAFGLTLRTSRHVPAGTAWLLERGRPGVVAHEDRLTIDTIDDRPTRSTWVQGFEVPAFAVTNPRAMVKLSGLATP